MESEVKNVPDPSLDETATTGASDQPGSPGKDPPAKEPTKTPDKRSISTWLPMELYIEVKKLAESRDESVAHCLRVLIAYALEKLKEPMPIKWEGSVPSVQSVGVDSISSVVLEKP